MGCSFKVAYFEVRPKIYPKMENTIYWKNFFYIFPFQDIILCKILFWKPTVYRIFRCIYYRANNYILIVLKIINLKLKFKFAKAKAKALENRKGLRKKIFIILLFYMIILLQFENLILKMRKYINLIWPFWDRITRYISMDVSKSIIPYSTNRYNDRVLVCCGIKTNA